MPQQFISHGSLNFSPDDTSQNPFGIVYYLFEDGVMFQTNSDGEQEIATTKYFPMEAILENPNIIAFWSFPWFVSSKSGKSTFSALFCGSYSQTTQACASGLEVLAVSNTSNGGINAVMKHPESSVLEFVYFQGDNTSVSKAWNSPLAINTFTTHIDTYSPYGTVFSSSNLLYYVATLVSKGAFSDGITITHQCDRAFFTINHIYCISLQASTMTILTKIPFGIVETIKLSGSSTAPLHLRDVSQDSQTQDLYFLFTPTTTDDIESCQMARWSVGSQSLDRTQFSTLPAGDYSRIVSGSLQVMVVGKPQKCGEGKSCFVIAQPQFRGISYSSSGWNVVTVDKLEDEDILEVKFMGKFLVIFLAEVQILLPAEYYFEFFVYDYFALTTLSPTSSDLDCKGTSLVLNGASVFTCQSTAKSTPQVSFPVILTIPELGQEDQNNIFQWKNSKILANITGSSELGSQDGVVVAKTLKFSPVAQLPLDVQTSNGVTITPIPEGTPKLSTLSHTFKFEKGRNAVSQVLDLDDILQQSWGTCSFSISEENASSVLIEMSTPTKVSVKTTLTSGSFTSDNLLSVVCNAVYIKSVEITVAIVEDNVSKTKEEGSIF